MRVSSKYSSDLCVDIPLLSNRQTHHYVLITDLMRVVEYMRGKLNRDRNQICRKCFHPCSSIDTLQRHQEMCYQDEGVVITMPKPGQDTHRFKNLTARWSVPRVIYFDLELLLLPVYGPQPDPEKSSTQTLEIHQPCCYALAVVEFGKREVLKFELKRGENFNGIDRLVRIVGETNIPQKTKVLHVHWHTKMHAWRSAHLLEMWNRICWHLLSCTWSLSLYQQNIGVGA